MSGSRSRISSGRGRFYDAALAPLGMASDHDEVTPEQTESGGTAHRLRQGRQAFFWIGDNERVGEGTHVAFTVDSRAEVDAFYEAAMAAGGKDNGAPGLRPQYTARIITPRSCYDPDGINIEAVCHKDAE